MKKNKKIYSYYNLTFINSSPIKSYDPLDADIAINLQTMRMLYSTPVEFNDRNELTSNVLDSFSYNEKSKTINFLVKENIFFSDGSTISPNDIVLSILRMLLKRPQFPVIKNIQGKNQWLKLKAPLTQLPSGITLDGNLIKIKFDNKVTNPLFRFCLEIFSVIPEKCIDKNNNKLLCDIPPYSGPYKTSSAENDSISFEKVSSRVKGPKFIKFKFIKLNKESAEKITIQENEVFYGIDFLLISQGLSKIIERNNTIKMPSSLFLGILINPNVTPFDDPVVRRKFSDYLRQSTFNIYGESLKHSSSILPQILPGYKDFKVKLDPNLKSYFKNQNFEIEIDITSDHYGQTVWKNIFTNACNDIGIKCHFNETFKNSGIIKNRFVAGKSLLIPAGSGFWAQDPIGDIQMYFTPGMHKTLNFLTQDKELLNLINQINTKNQKDSFLKLNNYIHKDAKFNTLIHARKIYLFNNPNIINNLPQAIASPYPWQIFRF